MSSLETYVMHIKPAIDKFIKDPTNDTLAKVEQEIKNFDFGHMRIFQVQILVPLVIKLDELTGVNQELRTSLLDCLRQIISKVYLSEEKGLRSILVVVLQQLRNDGHMRHNLSEEIKLSAVLCIREAMQRSTSDVLEAFYAKEQAVIIGQILIILVELISREKYRILVKAALDCIMVIFYCHDQSDVADIVLRSQVANTLFLFLPKVVTVLHKTALADDIVGVAIKATAIKALGRIICLMFEETSDKSHQPEYDASAFRALFVAGAEDFEHPMEASFLGNTRPNALELEKRLQELQAGLRSQQWMKETAKHLRPIFVETTVLRAHSEEPVRKAYAKMCCSLLKRCPINLQQNFLHILESVVALAEDKEDEIAMLCTITLNALQKLPGCARIFDENAELLLDLHLNKWPRILHRCDDYEQFGELLFLKGFLRNVQPVKLQLFLLIPKNLEKFVMCLLATVVLEPTRDMLDEDHSLRYMHKPACGSWTEHDIMPWRRFKHLSTSRCVDVFYDICAMLGIAESVNRLIFDYVFELIERRSAAMIEAILLLTLLTTSFRTAICATRLDLVEQLLVQLFDDDHWHLALKPDTMWRLVAVKPTSWYTEHTPGLYESAVEVRTQDYDSDDETEPQYKQRVSMSDAKSNVLHTCVVLDAVGHCALIMGQPFDKHLFRSLHKVLLKLSSSNTLVYYAASFAFNSMQYALHNTGPSDFLDCSIDYISFHIDTLLKISPHSSAAVDLLTVALQYITRESVPYLCNIFETIHEECIKLHQKGNVHGYLRVYRAFLLHIDEWKMNTDEEIQQLDMQVVADDANYDILSTWLAVLKKRNQPAEPNENGAMPAEDVNMNEDITEPEEYEQQQETTNPPLPQHIEMTKEIIAQTLKFISSSDQVTQILALECLASGVPLLADYENQLLPLVHLLWEPLMAKFRQKDVIVLNRCYTLLHVLAVHAKSFILKRSLSDVIPQLKEFLKTGSIHSKTESSAAQTQEYKLQVKLLGLLADFIKNLQLDGKDFWELLGIVGLYLSFDQPRQLQNLAVDFFKQLIPYNGPYVYISLLERVLLRDYDKNVSVLLEHMGFVPEDNDEEDSEEDTDEDGYVHDDEHGDKVGDEDGDKDANTDGNKDCDKDVVKDGDEEPN